jgi:CheY-like chemotaxis protein
MQNIKGNRQPGKTVLVVDDSAMVRRTVCSALLSDGFDVCGEAADGQEAIELAGKFSPDLIILDLSTRDEWLAGRSSAPKAGPQESDYSFHALCNASKAVEQQLRTIEVDSVISKGEPLSKLMEKAHALLGD